MKEKIDVSFVMTVYNKEKFLPSVLQALLHQTGVKNPEYIFVDDCSTDKSVAIIRKMTKGIKNVTLVAKKQNQGISITTNQALSLAKGTYTRPLDSDDILPLDSTQKMLDMAKKYKADMVYGSFVKTGRPAEELTQIRMPKNFLFYHKDNALWGVLTGRFVRMGQLIKTSVIRKAGGVDERVFIQDESMALRCAFYAKGLVKMFAPAVLVPQEDGNFSGNKVQLDHDRFLAHYYFLVGHKNEMSDEILKKLNERLMSAYWKLTRKTTLLPYLHPIFFRYLISKAFHPMPDFVYLKKITNRLKQLPNIRRSQGTH